MAIVNCNKKDCIDNIAGECVRQEIYFADDECMCYIKGASTGEIIEQQPIPLVYPKDIQD